MRNLALFAWHYSSSAILNNYQVYSLKTTLRCQILLLPTSQFSQKKTARLAKSVCIFFVIFVMSMTPDWIVTCVSRNQTRCAKYEYAGRESDLGATTERKILRKQVLVRQTKLL